MAASHTPPAELRYCDLYRERFEAMREDPEIVFQRLFGGVFIRMYEEQLKRLAQ